MSTANASASIVVNDLVKVYEPSPRWMRVLVRSNIKRAVTAVDHITFEVSPGEICVMLGPNGAGKTTTFRILVGLTTPTAGRSSVMGFDSEVDSVQVRKQVGWMPGDQRSLLLRHSVEENLRFHGKLQGLEKRDLTNAVGETLELVGLDGWGQSTGFALSAGMKARLQLARALLHKPRVLILDEPTGAVDPVASHELVHLITDIIAERGIAALISSHRLEEIETLHSRVLLLDRGRLRYDGDLDKLRREYSAARLEIAFRTPEAADGAELGLKSADVGTVTREGTVEVACELKPDIPHATVLRILEPQAESIVSLRETETPLHTILANIYRDKREEDEE